jgi:hypothetical protein
MPQQCANLRPYLSEFAMRLEVLTTSLRLFPLLCVAALSIGCGDDTPAAETAGETTAASSTAGETSTGDTTTDTDTDTPPDVSTTATTRSFVSDEAPDTTADTDTPLGNLGDMCMTDDECAEDLFCNGVVGLGGICSECASDTDCPDGSNCTITSNGWFACGDGSQGQMCESDATCAEGLYCAEVVDLGGLFNGNFCSECSDDSHCADGQLCAPVIEFMDLMNISGQRSCIDPESAPNDSLCDDAGSGDEQCAGFCTTADLMGFIMVGVCGDCETDQDCPMNGTCMPAMIGLEGFSGSVCG